MCGRFTMTKKQKELVQHYNAEIEGVIKELYNAAPSQMLPVITNNNPAKISLYRWGMANKALKNMPLINIRTESLTQKTTFEEALKFRRCLIPADGFYEWQKGSTKPLPHYVTLKNNELFSFAGLWEIQQMNEISSLSFAILTIQPNKLMEPIHTRMPVILCKAYEQAWLSNATSINELISFLTPYDANAMKAFPVSDAVNAVKNNSPNLITPRNIDAFDQTLF